MYAGPEITPCAKVFFENATSLCSAEKTRKHAREILRSQPNVDTDKIFKGKLNKSSHNTHNQNKRDFVNFLPHAGKKVHEIEKDESDEPSDQSDYDFFY